MKMFKFCVIYPKTRVLVVVAYAVVFLGVMGQYDKTVNGINQEYGIGMNYLKVCVVCGIVLTSANTL